MESIWLVCLKVQKGNFDLAWELQSPFWLWGRLWHFQRSRVDYWNLLVIISYWKSQIKLLWTDWQWIAWFGVCVIPLVWVGIPLQRGRPCLQTSLELFNGSVDADRKAVGGHFQHRQQDAGHDPQSTIPSLIVLLHDSVHGSLKKDASSGN